MKAFQQNLLIALALSLCALCAFQWYGQARQRNQLDQLTDLYNQKTAAVQEYTNSIRNLEHEVGQMDASITELKGTTKSNDETILSQRGELSRLAAESAVLTNEIAQYKQALDTAQAKLKEAYDGIGKQNDAIKELTAQRDDFLKKYNDSVTDRNQIVNKYNELAARFEKLQSGNGKP